jgi:hypothetical protein
MAQFAGPVGLHDKIENLYIAAGKAGDAVIAN